MGHAPFDPFAEIEGRAQKSNENPKRDKSGEFIYQRPRTKKEHVATIGAFTVLLVLHRGECPERAS